MRDITTKSFEKTSYVKDIYQNQRVFNNQVDKFLRIFRLREYINKSLNGCWKRRRWFAKWLGAQI